MSDEDDRNGYAGQQGLTSDNSEHNQNTFISEQTLGEARFHFAAKIVAVHGGGLEGSPTVDIQPLVKQMDGVGKAQSHGTIYGVKVPRVMAGDSMIIADPAADDVCWFSVACRDHSSVAENDWKEGNPGSFRRNSMSDAVYHGTMHPKRVKPKQWVMFTKDGMQFQDRNSNKLVGSKDGWNMNGVVITDKGEIKAPGNVTAGQGTADQVTLQGHAHGTSGPPTPGS
ncbi:hypothetical protein Q8W71_13835 [Methylobacterium sp. NEAU 140]|uniref:hypothetical protein n=1 Tax=Methylobacterium sp. NEAU 140 TaxID=3064945 RepID=UPI0027325378|nr:hypothetical protein [Methylobacterium sp. NEAU 140]MDP4023712.1 hypothetical protein [Methylobacterium sp. NEAU 140]